MCVSVCLRAGVYAGLERHSGDSIGCVAVTLVAPTMHLRPQAEVIYPLGMCLLQSVCVRLCVQAVWTVQACVEPTCVETESTHTILHMWREQASIHARPQSKQKDLK